MIYSFRIETHDGLRVIELEEQEGSDYKPNTHQTDILCQVAVQLVYATACRKGLKEMRVAEWCAGFGAAAISVAATGCGYVEASDINRASLEGVAKNSKRNKVSVDTQLRDILLSKISKSEELFDLIVVNPPCVPDCAVSRDVSSALEQSMRAGHDGLRFFREVLLSSRQNLLKDGCLAVVLTSSMDLVGAINALDDIYGSGWYAHPITPILANVAKMTADDDRADRMLAAAMSEENSTLIFRDLDGMVKRLTWVIVAHNDGIQRKMAFGQRLPFFPFGHTMNPSNIPLTTATNKLLRTLQQKCRI